jgi:hypothetical protein
LLCDHQDQYILLHRLFLVLMMIDDQQLIHDYVLRYRSVWIFIYNRKSSHSITLKRQNRFVLLKKFLQTSWSLSGKLTNKDLPPVSIRAPWIRYCIRDRCILSLNLAENNCALSSNDKFVVWPRSYFQHQWSIFDQLKTYS